MSRLDMPHGKSIAIVGAGALGSLIAGRLARAGAPVIILNRPSAHLERIRAEGLTLIARDGASERIPVPVTSDPAAVADCPLILVAVKTWATDAALRPLRGRLTPETWVISLQNGLGADERLRVALGDRPRLGIGVTSLGAARVAPGVVREGGIGPSLFGAPGQPPPAILQELAARFLAAEMPAAAISGIEQAVWRKLAVNAAINGLTALAGVANGAIVADPDLHAAAVVVAREVEAVARAEGHELGDVERALRDVAEATATNRSSMRQDLEAGGPTEVDAIHGAIVARAARHGLAVPANQTIAAIIRARTRPDNEEQDRWPKALARRTPAPAN